MSLIIKNDVAYFSEAINFEGKSSITKKVNLKDLSPKNIIVGFSGFNFSFGSGTDHHLKDISLKISHSVSTKAINGITNYILKITIKYTFNDNSSHNAKSASVKLCAVAVGENADLNSDTSQQVRALNSFSMSYGDEDHHVQNLGASPYGAFMEDYSGNEAKCNAKVTEVEVDSGIIEEMKKQNIFLINCFYMSNNEDHHISEVSVSVTGSKKKLVMSDKSKNRADYVQCTVNEEEASSVLLRLMNISLHGKNRNLKAYTKDIATLAESHIQGAVKTNGHYVLSHNNKGKPKGMFIIVNGDGSGYSTMPIDFENYNHPGGMQRYKDYLIVAVENSGYTKSKIALYKVKGLTTTNTPTYLRTLAERDNMGAAAVGICCDEKNKKYIMAVYNPHTPPDKDESIKATLDIYEASSSSTFEETTFKLKKTIQFGYATAQGIGIFSGSKGELYFLKFKSPYEGGNYVDAINIYRVNDHPQENDEKLYGCKKVACRHMHTERGSSVDDVHFRWGTGLEIEKNSKVRLIATRRNCLAKRVWINEFE